MNKKSLSLLGLFLLLVAPAIAQTQVWVIYVGTNYVDSDRNYNHERALNVMIDNLNEGSGGSVNYGANIIAVDTIGEANSAISDAHSNGASVVLAIEGNPSTGRVYDFNGDHAQSDLNLNSNDSIQSCANGVINENDIGDRCASKYGGTFQHLENTAHFHNHYHHYKKKKWWHFW